MRIERSANEKKQGLLELMDIRWFDPKRLNLLKINFPSAHLVMVPVLFFVKSDVVVFVFVRWFDPQCVTGISSYFGFGGCLRRAEQSTRAQMKMEIKAITKKIFLLVFGLSHNNWLHLRFTLYSGAPFYRFNKSAVSVVTFLSCSLPGQCVHGTYIAVAVAYCPLLSAVISRIFLQSFLSVYCVSVRYEPSFLNYHNFSLSRLTRSSFSIFFFSFSVLQWFFFCEREQYDDSNKLKTLLNVKLYNSAAEQPKIIITRKYGPKKFEIRKRAKKNEFSGDRTRFFSLLFFVISFFTLPKRQSFFTSIRRFFPVEFLCKYFRFQ